MAIKWSLGCFTVFFLAIGCQQPQSSKPLEGEDHFTNLPFQMDKIQEPTIPDNQVSILDFGAESNGQTKNTKAFADAIQAASDKGGGKVIVPRGIWLTGPIVLKSRINLHLEDGALIVFTKDFDDYPLIETSFEGLNTVRCQSPISGVNLENVAITGKGIIDGSGDAWRPVKKSKLTESQWQSLVASGGVLGDDRRIWYPSEKSKLGNANTSNFNVPNMTTMEQFEEVKDFLRPVMVSLVRCKNVLLDGPTFQNSPAWNIHPLMCENVILRNLNVRNPWYSQNGDGLDLESCKNSLIYNCSFDVGDDAICFKSGKNEDGRKRGMPTENAIVKNCVVYHGHGGFVVGSEMSGGVKNVLVTNCTFIGTDVGLRFKSTRGRGGVVENIYISNIDMIDIPTEAIRFNLYYGGQSPIPDDGAESNHQNWEREAMPVSEETPQFKNIFIEDVVCKGAAQAVFLQGLPEMNLQNFVLKNVDIEARRGLSIIDAKGVTLENIRFKISDGPALFAVNASDIKISGMNSNFNGQYFAQILGNSNEISFSDVPGTGPDLVYLGKGVNEGAVQWTAVQ